MNGSKASVLVVIIDKMLKEPEFQGLKTGHKFYDGIREALTKVRLSFVFFFFFFELHVMLTTDDCLILSTTFKLQGTFDALSDFFKNLKEEAPSFSLPLRICKRLRSQFLFNFSDGQMHLSGSKNRPANELNRQFKKHQAWLDSEAQKYMLRLLISIHSSHAEVKANDKGKEKSDGSEKIFEHRHLMFILWMLQPFENLPVLPTEEEMSMFKVKGHTFDQFLGSEELYIVFVMWHNRA